MIKVILGLIIIVFTFWGVGSYSLRKGNRVAVVNGATITLDQYREAYNGILERLRRQFGNNLNDEMLQLFNVRQQALDSVIDQALLLDEAERLHLRVTDDDLVRAIQNTPAFQVNGRFDPDRYRRILSANRMSPESFEAMQRQSMIIAELRELVRGGVKVSDVEARALYNWNHAALDVEYVLVRPDSYKDIQPTREAVEAYFGENESAYRTDALVKTRYLLFDPADYVDRVTVDPEEIRDYYDTHLESYEKPKTVEARHILFKVGAEDGAEVEAAAREKALGVLEEIRNGADFAEMAREHSEGPSRESGGYLGAFRKEAMVAPFAEKAFSMEAGEVSEPVRTAFGWHLIKVEKINPATTETLEAAEAGIREKLAADKAQNLAYDDAETAYDMSFGSRDLESLSKERGNRLYTTELFSRKGPEEGVKDPEAFAAAAFALETGDIGEVQEIDGVYYIIQVVDEVAPEVPPLEDVFETVRADVVKAQQDEMARRDAEDLLKRVGEGASLADAGQAYNLTPERTGWFKRNEPIPGIGYEPAISQALFQLSQDSPLLDEAMKGREGYCVALFKDRKPPDAAGFDKEKQALRENLLRQKEAEAFEALLAGIRERSEIEIAEAYRE